MNNKRYCFFVSYPRAVHPDKHQYEQFKKLIDQIELNIIDDMVEELEPYFIDTAVENGEIWTEKIKYAIRKSHTMIAFCVPRYFQRPFCGKELTIFIRRMHLLKKGLDTDESIRKIIFIMWSSQQLLNELGFPQRHLKKYSLSVGDMPIVNIEGLGYFARKSDENSRNVFEAYAGKIAKLILKEVTQNKLPEYAEPFDLDNVLDAFKEEEFNKIKEGVCAFDLESLSIPNEAIQASNTTPQTKEKLKLLEDRNEELPFLRVPGGNKQ